MGRGPRGKILLWSMVVVVAVSKVHTAGPWYRRQVLKTLRTNIFESN